MPTEVTVEEQPVVEETTIEGLTPVEEVPSLDVVPTEVTVEEQPVVEETTTEGLTPVEEVTSLDVVPTEVTVEEQPVVEENQVNNDIAPQPLLDLQFDQVSPQNETQTNNNENVDNSSEESGEDVWQF